MKKQIGALVGAAALAGAAAYGVSDALFKALIARDFRVPAAVSKFITEKEGGEGENPLSKKHKECMKYILDYGFERHTMINDRGQKLRGYLMRPKNPSDVYVFGSHGYRSDGKGEWCYFAKFYLEEMGYNLFFVDHQSHGESEGEYIGFSSHEHKDCLKWLSYMNNNFGDIRIILHGISMGSATVMLMTGNRELPSNVKFTIADCGFTSAMDEFDYKIDSLRLPFKPIVPIICAINHKKAGYDFQKDTNALEAIKSAKVPVLFVHGDKDLFVPTKMVYELYDACTSEKDLLVVEGADHAKSYHIDKEGYESRIRAFTEKYL